MKRTFYPRRKPSDLDWLGNVPAHWEVKRLGYLFRFYSGGTPSTSENELWDGELPWVSAKDMKSMIITDTQDHISEKAVRVSTTCKLPVGSLLIVNRSGILKHSLPAAVNAREMAINQDIRGCVPLLGVDAMFITYLIQGNQGPFLTLWRQQGATVESLNFESVKATRILLPPYSEQQSITAFLDRETRRVDRLVAKKRELIERLKEKRTALISRTITRGLPPAAARAAGFPENPPLKSSGLDWLGDIPKHWKVRRLKFELWKIEQGWSPQCDNTPASEDEWGVLKAGAVNGSEFDPNENKRLPDEEVPMREFEIKTGDFLISRANTRELLGSAALVRRVKPQLLLCDKLYRLTIRKRTLNSEFLLRFMRSTPGRSEFERDASGSSVSMQNIGQQSVRNLWITIPPLPEQTAIATYLDTETVKLDALIKKVEAAVERLQEYRTTLITAAVTGKIDVRKAAK